jgi:hypothetical protein
MLRVDYVELCLWYRSCRCADIDRGVSEDFGWFCGKEYHMSDRSEFKGGEEGPVQTRMLGD